MTTQRQRRRGKTAQGIANHYDAGGSGRRMRGWNPPTVGPNRALQGFAKIRARALDSVRNDWSGEASVQKWTTALVGTGIVPRWDDELLTLLWAAWGRVADADGVLDVYGLQALGIRSWLAAGEVFVRRRSRPLQLGLPVPLQIQLIESDYCPVFDADQWPGMPAGNKITQGIERNRFGVRTAYWMFKEHPGDKPQSPTSNDLIRIPAREIRHVYEVKRAGQLRGVSSLAPVLVRLRSTGDFEDAVLDRQKLANLFTLFITKAMPDSWGDLDIDSDTGLPKFYGDDGSPVAGLEPGIAQELKPGEDVKFANPPEAGVTFSDYLRTTNLGTASGQGLPYELFSGDIANVSDRTLRVIVQEFRRFAEQRQWHVAIPMMCQPVVEWFAEAAVLAGKYPLAKLEKAKTPEHNPHGWEYIHPVQDVEGKIMAIEAGLTSKTRVITARGDDPRKIATERAADKALDDELGLTPPEPLGPAQPPAGGEEEPGRRTARQPAPKNQQAGVSPEVTAMLAVVAQMAQGMQAMVAQMQAMAAQQPQAAQPAAPQPLHVHAHIAAPAVSVAAPNVTNEVHPTPVTVQVEAPTVTVEAPAVNITNEVQPAAVQVDVTLPDRQTTSVIERDGQGQIASVTQTETTLQ